MPDSTTTPGRPVVLGTVGMLFRAAHIDSIEAVIYRVASVGLFLIDQPWQFLQLTAGIGGRLGVGRLARLIGES